jgi:membrane-bound lytic murein transglycosylase B
LTRLPLALAALSLLTCCGAQAEASAWPDPPQLESFVAEMAERHGLPADALRRDLEAIRPNPVVLQAIAPPADPGVRSWQRYRARFLGERRIRDGAAFWTRHAADLRRAEREYGVPAAIIVAIIGVETEYGRNTGKFEVFEALATLAFAYPPRAAFFRGELEEFLLLARENGLPLRRVAGSFAGAIGIPQFMPGSQRRYAVDFDGDGRVDLLKSPIDAIGSVARFLKLHGWATGEPVVERIKDGVEVRAEWLAAGLKPTLERTGLEAAGLPLGQIPAHQPAALVDLVTPEHATEYWWGFGNFYAITRYNRSSFYAMSVVQLAEAVERRRGAGVARQTIREGSRASRRPAG